MPRPRRLAPHLVALAQHDRVFPPNLLAAFPAVAGVPTVVVG